MRNNLISEIKGRREAGESPVRRRPEKGNPEIRMKSQ